MKPSLWRTLLGLFLIVLGVASLAQYSGIFPWFNTYWAYIIASLMALGGLAFIYALIEDRLQWWAIIPGLTLLGLSGLIFLVLWQSDIGNIAAALFMASVGLSFLLVYLMRRDFWWALIPSLVMFGLAAMLAMMGIATLTRQPLSGQVPAAVFLGFIGLGFVAVYLVRRESWWPIIPAGSMISVAALVGTGNVANLFLGLGLTFVVLSLLPSESGRMRWPLIPGATLFIIGLIFNIGKHYWGNYVFPLMLILAGLYLIGRALLHNVRGGGRENE
jgi:hypothetical protein